MRPKTEVIRCDCGRTFIRTNWKLGPGKSVWKHRGRSAIYCDSCREERLRGRAYGKALVGELDVAT